MPHDPFKPMLATAVPAAFDRKDWLFEIKWDGYRTIAEVDHGAVKIYSRNGSSFNERFPEIAEALKKIRGRAVLDGEVVALDDNGEPRFQWLQDREKNKRGEVVYYIFDILFLNGKNLQDLPLRKRKTILKDWLPRLPNIVYGDHVEEFGKAFFAQAAKRNLEGIMAKDANSHYLQGQRTGNWLKIKTHLRQEAVIGGYTQPQKGRYGFGALLLGVYEKEKLKYIGSVGSGFDDEMLRDLYRRLKAIETAQSPFAMPPIGEQYTWVKPKFVCEVSFAQWTDEGLMRQPTFVGLRSDKSPTEVIPESPVFEMKNTEHLEKIFWPKDGYTKADLIEYYKQIAPIVLPYLKDRPESLLRYPNGIKGESFFQKNMIDHPDWIKTIGIYAETENKTINFLVCNDKRSLLYMANLGCIDINPWNSRVGHLDSPDYLILDLDPVEISFEKVVETAMTAHKVLEEIGIEGYLKTSGADGLHIYIPMGAKYDYEQTRNLAQIIAGLINARIPRITSLERNPENRKAKVYLDCFQNSRGQTLACPYCLRPRDGAPVSTPLEWSELKPTLRPGQFSILNIFDRLEKKGDPFKPVLGKGIDVGKVIKQIEAPKSTV